MRRLAALLGGILALWLAVASPLAAMDHQLLTAHMAQHLLLMTVAAPLILLGAPAIFFPRGIIHPVICWLSGTSVVIGWHVPALFALGMSSAGWHPFEQTTFLVAGLLFWRPVIQPRACPPWGIPIYLFLATLPCDALSAFLTFCGRVVYPHYLSMPRDFISPLADQELAGALMWVWVTFVYLAPAVVVTLQLLSPQAVTSSQKPRCTGSLAPNHVSKPAGSHSLPLP
jgi:putative membrane protein